jgi:hypothetical protein
MSWQSQEKVRLATYALDRYGVEGHVLPYELVAEMLHKSYRDETLSYFAKHKIKWWSSKYDLGRPPVASEKVGLPTGHLNSSQVAAVNHLEPARADRSVALTVLANVDPSLIAPVAVEDDGFVAYEWIGAENYLAEPGPRTRGSQVTSLDALMCARRADGTVALVGFEWKYLESYGPESRATSRRGTDRVAIYRQLLQRSDSPIAIADPASLFYDPYEQLMRQTLLLWQMAEHREFGASDWIHIHVVPAENVALRSRGAAAPDLVGESMAEAWQSVLREPERYRLVTPTELLEGVGDSRWTEWRQWLRARYGT